MLELLPPSSGLLFASFLYREDLHSEESLQNKWEALFGEGFTWRPEKNPLNDYYKKEMGEGLKRVFFVTSKLFPRESLLATKLLALDWEREAAPDQKRQINIDIGFLTLENLLLATTKNFSHRVYLGQNIFADLTYHFHQGKLESLPWTYPDYQEAEKTQFFTWCRSYLAQVLLSK